MNVIVTNKQKKIIDNANIDAIKDFNGLFNVDDLIAKLKNYFFSKVILDATSVVNFASDEVIKKLADSIGPERLVILLPHEPKPPKEFVDTLTNMKIYNFSNNIEEVVNYINNPNTNENIVDQSSNTENFYVDNSIKATDQYEEENTTNIENNEEKNINDYVDNNIYNNDSNYKVEPKEENNYQAQPFTPNIKETVNTSENDNNNIYEAYSNEENTKNFNYNSNNDFNMNNDTNKENNDNNTFYGNQSITINNNEVKKEEKKEETREENNKKVYGVKNVTAHAGSTTLIYLMKKMLQKKKNKRVLAIEVNTAEFMYFRDNDMISVRTEELINTINSSNAEVIFVDLNDYYGNFDIFTDIIYLVEPSLIKLNKLMMTNRFAFHDLENKKIILNKSMLSNNEMNSLSNEAKVEMLLNIPPLNDRSDNDIIVKLLNLLNLM